ncbi:MAG: hypothetical protein LBD99_03945 [Candidatus Margulisbacteria bacterium]|jgi:lipid-A-disaccharide synthase|nr:hypothetical protein [Candidatus Margulisiibacteriota bacterium]
MKKELALTVNGPGELNGLVLPLVRVFRCKYPELVCVLYVVPCQFSAGTEAELAGASGLFARVFTLKEYRKYLFIRGWPEGYRPAEDGIVFYGGGDSWYARRLSRKYGWPLYGYDEGKVTHKHWFIKLFSRDLDGNLMVDAALAKKISYQAVPAGSPELTVGLYPGSREKHLRLMIGFFSAVAGILQAKYPQIRLRWGITPELRSLVERGFPDRLAAPYEQDGEKYDLIISLTGTNTAINAALGIPMLVLLPFNDPALIPFTGLFGLISDIPFIGRLFKALLLRLSLRKMRYISIPNIKAGREIVPELRGFLTPEQVAHEAERVLLHIAERERMHRELPVFIGKPGAQNIADYFAEILG